MDWFMLALPVIIAAAFAFLSGLFFGIWFVVRFCEVRRHE